MIILGIDPGTHRMGYGVIRVAAGRPAYLAAGVLRVAGRTTEELLASAKGQIEELLGCFEPQVLAIEKLFFAKNRTTGIQVAEARGVVLALASGAGLRIEEFAPNEIKMMLTGYGGADKKAVAKMVKIVLGKRELGLIDDATDALAVALVCADRLRFERRAIRSS